CRCGRPLVVRTAPRLEDGSPFPTTFYLTSPGAVRAVGTLEARGVMAEMTERLGADPELAAAYRRAHEDYLRRRDELGEVPEIEGVSAGGMPTRVKCLHVLVAHSLAVGPGINPLGDEALEMIASSWRPDRCTCYDAERATLMCVNTVAATDCGTNSIRLLIAERSEDGRSLRDITRRMEIVRLGQGVDRTGELDPEALQRTLAATARYAQL